MDTSITTTNTSATTTWAAHSALPRAITGTGLLISLLVIVFGSAHDLLDSALLTVLAVALLPLSVRNLVTGSLPRWLGGLGLALTATVLVHALDTWSL